jgi:hypothetical protein
MAGDKNTSKDPDGEGAGANPGPRKSGSKLTISNVTMGPIQIKLTRLPTPQRGPDGNPMPVVQPEENVITLPPLMVKPRVFEGELADLLFKDAFVQRLADSGSLVVGRKPDLSDGKRSTSDPEIPPDLQPVTTLGQTVSHVDNINLSTKKLNVTQLS